MFTAEQLKFFLQTTCLGRQVILQDSLESTNLLAEKLASCPEGLLIAADQQTGGRGRNGRRWFSPSGGNLYFSLLLHPPCQPSCIPQLALLAALSLHRALTDLLPAMPLFVKWPNDLWTEDGRKLAGILCTMACTGVHTEYAIVGIGLNVNLPQNALPPDLRTTGTSLLELTSRPWPREEILAGFLNQFEKDYTLWKTIQTLAPFLVQWNEASWLNGKNIRVEQGKKLLQGIADGITEEGHLRLRQPDNSMQFAIAGDAHVLSPRETTDAS